MITKNSNNKSDSNLNHLQELDFKFVDLQVNGYMGIDFSNLSLKIDDLLFVARELHKKNIEAFCPTIITSPLNVYSQNIPIIEKCKQIIKEKNELSSQKKYAEILGIHLEGPFINPSDGFRGVHNRDWIIKPKLPSFENFKSIISSTSTSSITRRPNEFISLITMAPEIEGAFELLEYIKDNYNITISIGHSNVNAAIIKKSLKYGVKGATHIGNGLPEKINRHSNPIWPLLAEDSLFGMFITDGFHIPDDLIKVSLRAKGIDKFIVCSDASALSGLEPGLYTYQNQQVIMESNGYLHVQGEKRLAGSGMTMDACINYLTSKNLVDEEHAYKIGHVNPLKLIQN